MPDLHFSVEGAHAVPFAATPQIALDLQIANRGDERIENVLLQVQLQLEVTRRKYNPEEQESLSDLFGAPDRWSETLRTFHWTRASVLAPPFETEVRVELPVSCTFDFSVAATKYFHALGGEIPLLLLFSGSIFYRDETDALRVSQISWSREARFRLPVSIWREMMDFYYPQTAWMCVGRDTFERLESFRRGAGIPTTELALERLLSEVEQGTPS